MPVITEGGEVIQPLSLKPGVTIGKLTAPMLLGLVVIQRIYDDHGVPCVITSGDDGQHRVEHSLHYTGNALDIRLPSRFTGSPRDDSRMAADLKLALNAPHIFDVVLESDHIHVEYDPKVEVA